MRPYLRHTYVLAILCCFAQAAFASPPAQTVVTVKKLCPTCGKNIVKKLSELPNVKAAGLNVKQRTIHVRCTGGKSVSPRAVWETVERGGELPILLDGPEGSFTAKPKF